MSVVTLIRAWPRIASSGALSPVMLAGGSDNMPYPAGYFAGIIAEPRFQSSVSFGDDGWAARAIPTVGALAWSPAEGHRLDSLALLYWRDAAIEVDRVVNGVSHRRLTGTVADATISEGRLVLTCADLAKALDKAIAPATFAGTGGIEGGDYATGRVKRRSFGQVWNVEGRLLAQAYNIYEFGDPAIPLQGCSALRDKGRAGPLAILGWQGSLDATFAALKAAAAPRGGGVFAPSIACAKWWTQPSGPLTADLLGQAENYSDSVVGIANQLLTLVSGPAILGLAEAIALRPGKAGLHIADSSETTAGALDRLLQRVTLGWSIEPAGGVRIWPWTFSGPVAALQATFIGRESTVRPVVQRTVGYRKNERIHNDGELSAILQASDIVYESGASVADKEPAEAGATKGAPPGTPIGDAEAQAVVDGLRTSILTVAESALRGASWRTEVDEIIKSPGGGTLRRLVEQLAMATDGVTTFVDFLRSVDSEGNAIWALTAQNSNGAVTGVKNLLTGAGLGKLSFVADVMEAVDPDGGNAKFIFRYGLDNRLILSDVYVERLEVGSVITGSLAANAVSGGDSLARVSPISGSGAWVTALTYNVTIPVLSPPVGWQYVAIITASQSFPSGDRAWDVELLMDGGAVAAAGGQKSEDSFAVSGRALWGTGSHAITVRWKGESGCSLTGMNMTILWFKR